MHRLERFRGRYRCFAYADAVLCILTVFGGTVSALGHFHKWWPYIAAVVLSIIPGAVLYGRLERERKGQGILGRYYQDFCPHGILEADMTFTRVVSLAVRNYGRISAPDIPMLSFPSLTQTYGTVVSSGCWLSYEQFKAECMLGLQFNDEKGFRERAALLIFAHSSHASECRVWFVKHAVLMKLFTAAKDKDLANILRCMWKVKVLSPAALQDCTTDAFRRLSENLPVTLALCQRLQEELLDEDLEDSTKELVTDPWLARELPKYKAECGNTQPANLGAIESIKPDTWFDPGKDTECQLCGYRRQERQTIWQKGFHGWRKGAFRAQNHCEICNLNTLRKLNTGNQQPAPAPDPGSNFPAPGPSGPSTASRVPSAAALNPEPPTDDAAGPGTRQNLEKEVIRA
jgi:hypothetical protein